MSQPGSDPNKIIFVVSVEASRSAIVAAHMYKIHTASGKLAPCHHISALSPRTSTHRRSAAPCRDVILTLGRRHVGRFLSTGHSTRRRRLSAALHRHTTDSYPRPRIRSRLRSDIFFVTGEVHPPAARIVAICMSRRCFGTACRTLCGVLLSGCQIVPMPDQTAGTGYTAATIKKRERKVLSFAYINTSRS